VLGSLNGLIEDQVTSEQENDVLMLGILMQTRLWLLGILWGKGK
jgi:hypothetical protein